jgi:hypothetical protein
VTVNSTLITKSAGCNDDSIDANAANGNLITVGGFNDPFSPLLPSIANDHERYNLQPYITKGDTSIKIDTQNPSGDDNIFLAGIYVTGIAGFNAPHRRFPSREPTRCCSPVWASSVSWLAAVAPDDCNLASRLCKRLLPEAFSLSMWG